MSFPTLYLSHLFIFFYTFHYFIPLQKKKLSLPLKWHLQMRVKSRRQWISNWKRHWTEYNATGSLISNQMIWNVKWCEIVTRLNFMLPPSSMWHFFQDPLFRLVCKSLIRLYCSEKRQLNIKLTPHPPSTHFLPGKEFSLQNEWKWKV